MMKDRSRESPTDIKAENPTQIKFRRRDRKLKRNSFQLFEAEKWSPWLCLAGKGTNGRKTIPRVHFLEATRKQRWSNLRNGFSLGTRISLCTLGAIR